MLVNERWFVDGSIVASETMAVGVEEWAWMGGGVGVWGERL